MASKMGLDGRDLLFRKFSFDAFKDRFVECVIDPLRHGGYAEAKHGT